jgi:hypothetical protein
LKTVTIELTPMRLLRLSKDLPHEWIGKRPRETRRPPAYTPRLAFEPVALAENTDGGGAEIDMAFILATQMFGPAFALYEGCLTLDRRLFSARDARHVRPCGRPPMRVRDCAKSCALWD